MRVIFLYFSYNYEDRSQLGPTTLPTPHDFQTASAQHGSFNRKRETDALFSEEAEKAFFKKEKETEDFLETAEGAKAAAEERKSEADLLVSLKLNHM